MASVKPLIRYTALVVVAFAVSTAMAQQAPASDTGSTAGKPASQVHALTNAEFDALVAHPDKTLLIDVRRPDEVSSVGGFPVYLSIQLKDLDAQTQWIPKGRTLVLVSNHAGRASKAAALLTGKGFTVAGVVGVETYEKAGGTIAKIPVPAAHAPGAVANTKAD